MTLQKKINLIEQLHEVTIVAVCMDRDGEVFAYYITKPCVNLDYWDNIGSDWKPIDDYTPPANHDWRTPLWEKSEDYQEYRDAFKLCTGEECKVITVDSDGDVSGWGKTPVCNSLVWYVFAYKMPFKTITPPANHDWTKPLWEKG